jgi:hypothetical protein
VKTVIVTERAQAEIDQAAAWYEGRREGLGNQFLARVDEAISRIEISPEGYAVAYKDLRRAVLRQFTDYELWFQIRADNSLVIACLSARRRPALIRERQRGVIPFPE